MAATLDPKVSAAEFGRNSLLAALRKAAGANMMEANYQRLNSDLAVKGQFDAMVAEVADLPEDEKLSEVLARFALVVLALTPPQQQGFVLWHLYAHLRPTGLIEAVKPNIGSIVDLAGRRIPPKGGG